MNIQTILMPTDFSDCSNAALDYALFLAQRHSAELHLLHASVLHAPDPPSLEESKYPPLEEIAARLDAIAEGEMGRLIAEHGDDRLSIREVTRRSVAAAPAIVEYADDEDIDVIVMGTHGHRGVRRWFLGSVTEEVIRTAERPVFTIGNVAAARGLRAIERIVVPFDFSDDARHSLEVAAELAASTESAIDLVHVCAPMVPTAAEVGAPSVDTLYPDSSEIEAHLQRIVGEVPDVSIETHVLQGPIAVSLADFAERRQAQLIVIGTHGLSGIPRLMLGSVTERIVRTATCPVLVLPHQGGEDRGGAADS